jgi:formylglycine-generating enzyme required for sulfatase activity
MAWIALVLGCVGFATILFVGLLLLVVQGGSNSKEDTEAFEKDSSAPRQPPTRTFNPPEITRSQTPAAPGTFDQVRARKTQQPARRTAKLPRQFTNSIGMSLVLIPAGKFLMGSPKEEQAAAIADHEKFHKQKASDSTLAIVQAEGPQHLVELTETFYMGIYEVTQKQYKIVMGSSPSWFSSTGGGKDIVKGLNTDDFPVEQVSWEDSVAFCKELSALAEEQANGRTCRLPTEAEWEYSCRGGAASSIPFHFGSSLSSTHANFNGNFPYGGAEKGPYLARTCRVGSYNPNAFGLYDMHGNVREWCADWHGQDSSKKRIEPSAGLAQGKRYARRGGCWFLSAGGCRSAFRLYGPADLRLRDDGFRVVCVVRTDP